MRRILAPLAPLAILIALAGPALPNPSATPFGGPSLRLAMPTAMLENPCDNNDPDSPCNRTLSYPSNPGLCPDGSDMDPDCIAACEAAYATAWNAAQATACASADAACTTYLDAISDADDDFDDCVANGGGAQCTVDYINTTTAAGDAYDADIAAANGTMNYALAKARAAFYKCLADCCD